MKKIYLILIAWVLSFSSVVAFVGCNTSSNQSGDTTEDTTPLLEGEFKPLENYNYDIVVKRGKYYIVFEEGIEGSTIGLETTTVEFSSLKELKDTILNKTFDRAQLDKMNRVFPKDENGIMICNPNKLYEPVLPNKMKIREVHLSGLSYFFAIEEIGVANGFFQYHTSEEYREVFKRDYEEYFFNPLMHITDRRQVADRDAVITYYNTSKAELKTIQYQIGGLYILEDYILSCTNAGGLTVSDTVPNSVKIYGKKNGLCFVLSLHGFEERPTVEWLSSFGIREFTDDHLVE